MSRNFKIIFGVFLCVIFVVGLIIGLIWKDIPNVKFNPELKIYEVANFFLTLAIGLTIPLLVKKWVEDNRSVKSTLVDEIKNIICTLDKINTLISICHSKSSITKENKEEINYLFHKSELQITSLTEQLKISFDSQSKNILLNLKVNYHGYKDYLTGGDLMSSLFTVVDDNFFREQNTEYSKIETYLKTVIHKIHKF